MAFSSGFLKDRVTIMNRATATDGKFGRNSGGVKYEEGSTIWANVTWVKGAKALRENALDAFDTVMLRCRYTDELKRESRFKFNDTIYQIESFHADKMENTIQITATELTGNA